MIQVTGAPVTSAAPLDVPFYEGSISDRDRGSRITKKHDIDASHSAWCGEEDSGSRRRLKSTVRHLFQGSIAGSP